MEASYIALFLDNKQNTRIAGPNTKEYQGIPRLVFWANQRRPAEYQGYQAISEYQGIPNTWYTQTLCLLMTSSNPGPYQFICYI